MNDELLNCCLIECDGDAELLCIADGDAALLTTEDGENGVIVKIGSYEHYGGPYEVTPSQETQTLHTEGKVCVGDITVNPVPQNYGLITWNGYSLRVS